MVMSTHIMPGLRSVQGGIICSKIEFPLGEMATALSKPHPTKKTKSKYDRGLWTRLVKQIGITNTHTRACVRLELIYMCCRADCFRNVLISEWLCHPTFLCPSIVSETWCFCHFPPCCFQWFIHGLRYNKANVCHMIISQMMKWRI